MPSTPATTTRSYALFPKSTLGLDTIKLVANQVPLCKHDGGRFVPRPILTFRSCSKFRHAAFETHTVNNTGDDICSRGATSLFLDDPPYKNYFYSNCDIHAQVVITSPLPDSNLSLISPRLIVAWPAGNSGIAAFFEPENGINGSLAVELVPSSKGSNLTSINPSRSKYDDSSTGIKGVLKFNSSAVLSLSILGSVRAIRDFTEGPSVLHAPLQEEISVEVGVDGSALISRLWLDKVSTTVLTFGPESNSKIWLADEKLHFAAGNYNFVAELNYPPLKQLSTQKVFNRQSQELASQKPDAALSLAFLSYSDKLLAGAWRFLTYFGRDSMIAALLLEPVLSQGEGGAIEAVIGAVLERINRTDGSVCHEETIGDYATYLNLRQKNLASTEAIFDYSMVDTDFFLPVLMQRYFLGSETGSQSARRLLEKNAGKVDLDNANLTYKELARINGERVMNLSAPFATAGGQTIVNLIHIQDDTKVGQWRDSELGSGGGRIPYDVNTALVPAALRAIAALSRFDASIYAQHEDWAVLADRYAQIWEDETLAFFRVKVPAREARDRLEEFSKTSGFYNGSSQADQIDDDVVYHALALEGHHNVSKVDIMHTDDCFRLFFLNTTNDVQLTSFLNQTALNIMRPFPAGLMTPVGAVVANPALTEHAILQRYFTNRAYHGTVVWSWQLAMVVQGLEAQLGRCESTNVPTFCTDDIVYGNVRLAYNHLWDILELNKANLSQEVWSWVFEDGNFHFTPLGSLPPPPGVSSGTESNVLQLWSLAFLAVTRNEKFG